mmetsp:Transcript_24274/g.57855  ORF Transcript_24274/g.57855 Transcript_24274/m.57855 type:complete len:223 (+) Transcript_24274:998-1666(+)
MLQEENFLSLLENSNELVPEALQKVFDVKESLSKLEACTREVSSQIQDCIVSNQGLPRNPSWVLQLDRIAVPGHELQYVVLYASKVSSEFLLTRYGLAIKAFPNTQPSTMRYGVAEMITKTTARFWGKQTKPSDVYYVCIHGQCSDFVAAASHLQIPTVPSVASSLKALLCGALKAETSLGESLAAFLSRMSKFATLYAISRDEVFATITPEFLLEADQGGF